MAPNERARVKRKPKGAKYRNLSARGGVIYYERVWNGRRYCFSTRTTDWDQAAAVRDLYEQRRGRITKAGNPRARTLLVEAAWLILRGKNPATTPLRWWAQRVAVRRGEANRCGGAGQETHAHPLCDLAGRHVLRARESRKPGVQSPGGLVVPAMNDPNDFLSEGLGPGVESANGTMAPRKRRRLGASHPSYTPDAPAATSVAPSRARTEGWRTSLRDSRSRPQPEEGRLRRYKNA